MSVTINEVGFKAFQEREIDRFVQARAEEVVSEARKNVAFIMAGSFVDASGDVGFSMQPDGSAIIGIRDQGRVSRYLAAKAGREVGTAGAWLQNALRAIFPG